MTREIVKNSCIVYRNELEEFHHKEDKPSYIHFAGDIHFFKNDKLHRKNKPDIIWLDGTLEYYENDEFVKHIKT